MKFLIISGLSGAGKSQAASALEDMGYYCVDNMPPVLIPQFAQLCLATKGKYEKVALVTDVRGGQSFEGLYTALDKLTEMNCPYAILFIEASQETIIARYKETRRPHPLVTGGQSLEQAVTREEALLSQLRARADYIVNTTGMTHGNMRRRLLSLFGSDKPGNPMVVTVTTFGYKYGLPLDADLVFDVRFLPNPYYIEELKTQTGLDDGVSDFLNSYRQTGDFMKMLEEFISYLLPKYTEEGKTSLTVAFGCTGGKHRSVFVGHHMADYISRLGYHVYENNRDVGR
ncbi:MAG: RNase adapter RapZ [Oscillospiraceae bacterium]|nr:RNase adapter RapZ [Oscillospiraceae bacterium]